MEIIVNGEPVTVDDHVDLATTLPILGYRPGQAAVAVNEAFVPRERHAHVYLVAGDRIDIVRRIEGG